MIALQIVQGAPTHADPPWCNAATPQSFHRRRAADAGNHRGGGAFDDESLDPKARFRKDHPMKKSTLALIALLGLGALSACNTVSGAGKDIQGGGEAISDTADTVKKEL
jgi:predicted small secreted protein